MSDDHDNRTGEATHANVSLRLSGARSLNGNERKSLARIIDPNGDLNAAHVSMLRYRLGSLWVWYDTADGGCTVCILGAVGDVRTYLGVARRNPRDKSSICTGRHTALRHAFARMVYNLIGEGGQPTLRAEVLELPAWTETQ